MAKFRSPFAAAVCCTAGYPTYPSGAPHSGEDYVPVNKSSWDLFTIGDGEVYISKKQTGSYPGGYGAYGNYCVVKYNNGLWVLYAHMQSLPCIKAGCKVTSGQKIGVAGQTGNATGRHLHVEVSNMKGVSYNSSTWYTQFCNHRLKPSDYIDFCDYEEGFEVKKWQNGSTREPVYQTTSDCACKKNQIGSLDPRECCDCYGIIDGKYLVAYTVNGTTTKKCGFVSYSGGVK